MTWIHIDPDIQAGSELDEVPRVILFAFTMEYAGELAGRDITAGEAVRIAKSIPFSSIPDALADVVTSVCGYTADPDDDEDYGGDDEYSESLAKEDRRNSGLQ